jgi:hypothetical protein
MGASFDPRIKGYVHETEAHYSTNHEKFKKQMSEGKVLLAVLQNELGLLHTKFLD